MIYIASGKAASGIHGTASGSPAVYPNVQLSGDEFCPSSFLSSITSFGATFQRYRSTKQCFLISHPASPPDWAEISRNSVSDLCE